MANVKKEIEDRLLVEPRMEQLWDVSTMLAKQQIKVKTKKIKSDSGYDLDECTITYTTDSSIKNYIHTRAIVDSMKLMEDPSAALHFIKVLWEDASFGVDPSTGYNVLDVGFILINNFEK